RLLAGDHPTEPDPRRLTLSGFFRRRLGALGETRSLTRTLTLPDFRTAAWWLETITALPLMVGLPPALPALASDGNANSKTITAVSNGQQRNSCTQLSCPFLSRRVRGLGARVCWYRSERNNSVLEGQQNG